MQHGDRDTVRERYEGYALVVGAQAQQATDLTLDGAYRGVRAHLDEYGAPDGLVVGTFFQSTAAVRALTDAGLRIPKDVSVVSFDVDASNKYSQTTLTTVQQDIDDIARRSIDLPTHVPTEDDATPARAQVALAVAESCGYSSAPRTETE